MLLQVFEQALLQASHGLRRHVTPSICTVSGTLRLEGRTPTYYLKQLAANACLDLARHHNLQLVDAIEVI